MGAYGDCLSGVVDRFSDYSERESGEWPELLRRIGRSPNRSPVSVAAGRSRDAETANFATGAVLPGHLPSIR